MEAPLEPDEAPKFPNYQAPKGVPIADSKQSGVLAKRIMKMMPKVKAPRMKGIQSDQNVHVSHKKKTHPNPVHYW